MGCYNIQEFGEYTRSGRKTKGHGSVLKMSPLVAESEESLMGWADGNMEISLTEIY